ncbi:MAG: type VI secretion system tip protein TssI/VgrG [Myxococcota bacterium]
MTMLDSRLLFDTEADADGLTLHELRALERMSAPFRVELRLHADVEGGLAPETIDELLQAPAVARYGPGASHGFAGVLTEIELLDVEAKGADYRVVLEPRMSRAGLVRRSRVFQDQSIVDIVLAVLDDYGLSGEPHVQALLRGSYPAREYCVQFEESDLDFVRRLLEHEGVFFFFDGSAEPDKIVLADANTSLSSVPEWETVHFSERLGVVDARGTISSLRRSQRLLSAQVYERDYNWRTPGFLANGLAPADPIGFGFVAHYGEHVKDDAEAERIAQVRAEAINVERVRYTGRSQVPAMHPGFTFELQGAPAGELDIAYLVTEVRHRASVDGYSNELVAIPAATPYRPPRVTRKPRIDGIMHAKIDGEHTNTAAPLDAQGRYKVRLPFDLGGEFGGKASRWIRKAQPYAGANYGMHFPLHVGTEVMIAHQGGDPDRPVILGAVPNPGTESPVNGDYSTQSRIQTRAGIVFAFEDDA